MSEGVVVTGIGCISCFGLGHSAFIDALRSQQSGIAPLTRFDTSGCHSHQAATIRSFDPAAFIAPLKLRRVDSVGRLAIAATRLLFEDAGCVPDSAGRDDVGIALGTCTAGLDSLVEYLGGLTERGPTGAPAILFSNTVSNAPASLCAIEFRLRGPNVTFTQREASSLSALAFSVGAVRQGRVTTMITGGADWVEETFFKVHDRFRALSPRRGDRGNTIEAARPFDRHRNGFILGEGGFLMLVEAESAARARGARIYGDILGVGASASKTDLNEWPDQPAGPIAAMRLALNDARLTPDRIGAVMAAGNGSPELDKLEGRAICEVFGERAIPVVSVKGAIGESGAAGAAGIIAGLLSLASGETVATVGLSETDDRLGVQASNRPLPVKSHTFLVNSIASGGSNFSVIVSARPA
jgi:3-oxoacyl-[acyl-carrier-protein] synthase II